MEQREPLKSLGTRKLNRLLELARHFDCESQRCRKARAYYAACILQGAALEGMLLAMVDIHLEDVQRHLAASPELKRLRNDITRWDLDSLVKIAIGLRWLPARTGQRAVRKIGDWLAYVHEVRNLVHVGRHLREYPNLRVASRHFSRSMEIVSAAVTHLSNMVISEIEADMDQTDRRRAKKVSP